MDTEKERGDFLPIMQEIEDLIIQEWREENTPLALARLGQRLKSESMSKIANSGKNLKFLVTIDMHDRIRYLFSKRYTDLAAPLNQTKDISDDHLLQLYADKHPVAPKNPAYRRFKSEIWNAFTSPSHGDSRFVQIFPNGHVNIIRDGQAVSTTQHIYEVKSHELAFEDDGSRVTYDKARSIIVNWAYKNSIDINLLYKDDHRSAPLQQDLFLRTKTDSRSEQNQSSSTNNIFDNLSLEDLKRINIPADIVLKLFSKFER